ncbi:phosphoadenylyl-sulfate reductase [Buchnera aphidicola]|uniref:phosphoadenylyl-sulfate reductase n=1 Tax=Buchnera aphidicola TaxID=9 RepID=UPI003463F63C
MSTLNLKGIFSCSKEDQYMMLSACNNLLKKLPTKLRIAWSLKNLPAQHVLSSSFGIQSIVSLHLIIQQCPNIPIILIDTGYLFPETYRFIDQLIIKFNLNLKVFRSTLSPAWQEARYGKLWKKGIDGINFYNVMNKVHPMKVAFKKLSVSTWFSGLRRTQSISRKNLPYLEIHSNVLKVLPILDWSDQDIFDYIKNNHLDFHPLLKQGYSSVGDIHTTFCKSNGISEEETRFFGLKRECGLHDD